MSLARTETHPPLPATFKTCRWCHTGSDGMPRKSIFLLPLRGAVELAALASAAERFLYAPRLLRSQRAVTALRESEPSVCECLEVAHGLHGQARWHCPTCHMALLDASNTHAHAAIGAVRAASFMQRAHNEMTRAGS